MPSYRNRGPPDLPIAVIVKFDHYNRPTLHDGTVPIIPIRHTWFNSGVQCSHLQLPHKLAWAVRHHPQVPGPHPWQSSNRFWEFSCGRIFVACSRVRHLTDILFTPPFTFQCLANLFNSQCLHERQLEDKRLVAMQPSGAFSESTLTSPPLSMLLNTPSPPAPKFPIIHHDTPSLPSPDYSLTDEDTPLSTITRLLFYGWGHNVSAIFFMDEDTLSPPSPGYFFVDKDTSSPPSPDYYFIDEDTHS